MQKRPYPKKDGQRLWLSRAECSKFLAPYEDLPRKRLAFELGLHGLRTEEIVDVTPGDVRSLQDGADGHVLVVQDGKTGKRDVPISPELEQRIRYYKNAAQLRVDDELIDVKERQVRNWIAEARDALDDADELGMHDLRRTWATDCFYSLAFGGVPIAETLTMSWGGWEQSESGRSTFRQNYLGPVPDHITARAVKNLEFV